MKDFCGGFATREQTAQEIGRVYQETGYVLDPHTAVASSVYHAYREAQNDTTPAVIAATASPYKFARSVMEAIDGAYGQMDDFALIDELSKLSGTAVPRAIEEIRNAPVLHDRVIEKEEMEQAVKEFLGIA